MSSSSNQGNISDIIGALDIIGADGALGIVD